MADDPTKKFKFISPGVFVDEIDNSQLPATPASVGPMVIGRARKGPAMEPVTVSSFSEFIDVFGKPMPGNETGDISRYGNTLGPTYGAYAAQAWLRNSSPLTFMRTVGVQDPDASSTGLAGWKAGTISSTPSEGGAYGLFLWPSGGIQNGASANQDGGGVLSGALAATFYLTEGRILLSGTRIGTSDSGEVAQNHNNLTASACELYQTNANGDIDLMISSDGTFANLEKVTVSLNPDKNNFIRKVLNTNPTITNTSITRDGTATANQGGKYWLGETFEYSLVGQRRNTIGVIIGSGSKNEAGSLTGSNDADGVDLRNSKCYAAILPLRNQENTSEVGNDFNYAAQKSTTGFYFSQDLNQGAASASYDALTQQKLFRFEALTPGDWVQNEIKISIADIKAPRGEYEKYGTFSVLVRKLTDTDNKPVILERYDNCDLNPASPNYVAKKIGDKFMQYDTTEKRNREYGQYPNKSNYIRVEMNDDVDGGVTDPEMLPFGVFGPLTYRSVTITSGSQGMVSVSASAVAGRSTDLSAAAGTAASLIDGGPAATFGLGGFGSYSGSVAGVGMLGGLNHPIGGPARSATAFTASVIFPSVPLRIQSNWGTPKDLKSTYWGAWTGRSATDTLFNDSIRDMIKGRVKGLQTSPAAMHDLQFSPQQKGAVNDPLVIAWHFTLDDVSGSAAEGYEFVSGSRQGEDIGSNVQSVTAASASYSGALDAGLDRFTTVLHGGYEGFDVQEKDPFRNTGFNTANDEKTSYQLHTLRRAINIVSDTEDAQYNVITLPGIIQNNVTEHLLDVVEDRADALAIIDIDNIYTPDTENTESVANRNASTVKQAVDTLRDRNLNNSYGAAYAPWVRIRDSVNQRTLWAPPSVAALGVLSTTDNNQGPWFAPAGFTRGGLTEGAAGIPVLDVSRKYTQDQRDNLYDANINPIAKFPAEGIVVFGQKTLQQTRSALDRINVRRLMIYLKREISFIASRLIFDPNSSVTWDRFRRQAEVVLNDVKARFGIEEFRLVLDNTTTTPDLIDQNIIYAKLLVKPTRAVEFFAIDFVVTNSGAGFED